MRYFLVLFGLMICFVSYSQGTSTTLKCNKETNERIRKNCITTVIQEFVDANYNVEAIAIYAKPGTNRIYTRFNVNEAGNITDIQAKASSLELELEAIRVLQSFPYTIPTMNISGNENEIFEDTYTLPITFQVDAIEIDLSSQKRITGND